MIKGNNIKIGDCLFDSKSESKKDEDSMFDKESMTSSRFGNYEYKKMK